MSDIPDQNQHNAKVQFLQQLTPFLFTDFRILDSEKVVEILLDRVSPLVNITEEDERIYNRNLIIIFTRLFKIITEVFNDKQLLDFLSNPNGKLLIQKLENLTLGFDVVGILHTKITDAIRSHIETLRFEVDSKSQLEDHLEDDQISSNVQWFISQFTIVSTIYDENDQVSLEMLDIKEIFIDFCSSINKGVLLAILKDPVALSILERMAILYDCVEEVQEQVNKARN